MEITINVEELSDLIIKSSDGTVYRIVKDEPVAEPKPQPAVTKRFVNQTELRILYKCGHKRIKSWVAQGLSEIPDGKTVLYDLEELEEILRSKKI